MKKINNKGFALVETLIVSAFVIGIFSVMYANFYPMMGEYEKRENYDDISSIYNANLIKRLIENYKDEENLKNKIEKVLEGHYVQSGPYDGYTEKAEYEELESWDFPEGDENNPNKPNIQEYYDVLVDNMEIETVYLMPYDISAFKSYAKNSSIDYDTTQTQDYIDYLPSYTNNKYGLECRIIIKYKADANKESELKSGEFKYATIGVDCQ